MNEANDLEKFPTLTPEDLKQLKTDLLATVYNQTNTQLSIFQRGKCIKTSMKMKNRKTAHKSASMGIEDPMPSEDILNDIKLDKELDALRNIYELAYKELSKQIPQIDEDIAKHLETETVENTYENLITTIESRKQNNNEVDILTNEMRENKSTLKQLKDQLKMEKTETEEKITQKTERLEFLRDQLHNIKRINELECRLVEKWEANRLTQATIMGENEERAIMQQIIDLHRRLAGEQRLICEVEAFRKNEMNELLEKTVQWEQKFKDEKAKILAKNLKVSENIASLIKSHEKHFEVNEQRKQFVREYLEIKAEERRLYEEQMYRVECAVRIQAWWRGTMVRRGLGPYRKKSKKGKKSKSKK